MNNGHSADERFEKAFIFAANVHRRQVRKGSTVPYIAHLLAVAGLVLEHGGNEDQAIAALLHDAPEDQGGKSVLETIRCEFGDAVARLVAACTESYHPEATKWTVRKQAYLDHLEHLSPDALLIVGCDKINNAYTLESRLATEGLRVFDQFNGGYMGTRWWHRELAARLAPRLPLALARELSRLSALIASESWYHLVHGREEVMIEFQPCESRFWPVSVLRTHPLTFPPAAITITGAGANWMYAAAAAQAAMAGHPVSAIAPPRSLPVLVHHPDWRPALVDAAVELTRCNGHLVAKYPHLHRLQDNELRPVHERVMQATQPGDCVVLGGKMTNSWACAVTAAAVASGAERVQIANMRACEGAGLVVAWDRSGEHTGALTLPKPPLAGPLGFVANRRTVRLGIIGDPRCGKSVLAHALTGALQNLPSGSAWRLDVDGAAPTADWYLTMMASGMDEAAQAERLRGKRTWSREMEETLAAQLRGAMGWIDLLVVDLPGGLFPEAGEREPPQRIPPGREVVFHEVDYVLQIARESNLASFGEWEQAFARSGLNMPYVGRIVSGDPAKQPVFQWLPSPDGRLLYARIDGLDRKQGDALVAAVAPLAEAVREALGF